MPPSNNPNHLFTQTKDWIGRGQAEVVRQHDARAESGKTPLSLLVEDIKQDPQKHIQRLKRVMATAAVMALGGSSFNPNVVAQSQNLIRVETNTTQLQSNSEKSIQTNLEKESVQEAETKVVRQFVNQVFNPQGTTGGEDYSSMQSGGTPKAIKHALENGGTITAQNAPQIIMEAIKTNNGATNPINLKHYKQQIKMFNLNIEAGYTPTQALIKSQADCAKLNPAEIKAPRGDLDILNIIVEKISQDCTKAIIDSTKDLSETQKEIMKAQIEAQTVNSITTSKYQTPVQKKLDLTKLFESQGRLNAPEIKPTSTPIPNSKEVKTNIHNQQNKGNEVNGPFNNPTNPTVPPRATVESIPDKGFEWFQTMNQKAIQDTLMQLGIIFAVGGVATVSGIKATKALYQKYQAWESTLPHISNDETRRIFWENVDKMKSDYQEKKVKKQNFDAKFQGVVVAKLIKNTTEVISMQEVDQVFDNNPVNFNSTDVKQININLIENRPKFEVENLPQPAPQSTELQPKLGERWSTFIAGFREAKHKVLGFVKDKYESTVGVHLNNIKSKQEQSRQQKEQIEVQKQTAKRLQVKKEKSKQGNISKSVFNIRSMYSHLLLETNPWFEENRDEGAKAYDLEEETRQSKNGTKENRAELQAKMDRFEIPFVPEVDNSPKPESFVIPESMRDWSNYDLKAALILSEDNIKVIQKQSKYAEQAKKAADFINKIIKNHNQGSILQKIKTEYLIPESFDKLGVCWNRGPAKYGIGALTEKTIHRNLGRNPTYKYEKIKIFETFAYTFEHYLNILQGLKNHFKKNGQMQNALDVLIAFTGEQNETIKLQSNIRHALVQRRSSPMLENKGGVCKEVQLHNHISNFVTNHNAKTYYYSWNRPIETKEFDNQVRPLIDELFRLVFEKNILSGEVVHKENNTINIDRIEEILKFIRDLVNDYKIPFGDGKNETFDMHMLEHILKTSREIKRRLKQPADQLAYADNEYEVDIIPFGMEDPYVEPYIWNEQYPRQKSINPIRIETINGKRVIKYPTSLMFPEVLESREREIHFEKLLLTFKISSNDIISMVNALQNPNKCTENEAEKLKWFTGIITQPKYAFRPYRKPNPNIPQKPINLVEFLLNSRGFQDDEK
jgi:hypothetical protein